MIPTFPRALWVTQEARWRLADREVFGRYRGSVPGVGWSFVTTMKMLPMHTFIFAQVFETRWNSPKEIDPPTPIMQKGANR